MPAGLPGVDLRGDLEFDQFTWVEVASDGARAARVAGDAEEPSFRGVVEEDLRVGLAADRIGVVIAGQWRPRHEQRVHAVGADPGIVADGQGGKGTVVSVISRGRKRRDEDDAPADFMQVEVRFARSGRTAPVEVFLGAEVDAREVFARAEDADRVVGDQRRRARFVGDRFVDVELVEVASFHVESLGCLWVGALEDRRAFSDLHRAGFGRFGAFAFADFALRLGRVDPQVEAGGAEAGEVPALMRRSRRFLDFGRPENARGVGGDRAVEAVEEAFDTGALRRPERGVGFRRVAVGQHAYHVQVPF